MVNKYLSDPSSHIKETGAERANVPVRNVQKRFRKQLRERTENLRSKVFRETSVQGTHGIIQGTKV
jgi:hypothetical protein